MENVQNLINEIKNNLTQKSSSKKDEVRVMKAMLNDTSYKVAVYDKSGKTGEYCPAESAKQIVSSVLQHSAGISRHLFPQKLLLCLHTKTGQFILYDIAIILRVLRPITGQALNVQSCYTSVHTINLPLHPLFPRES